MLQIYKLIVIILKIVIFLIIHKKLNNQIPKKVTILIFIMKILLKIFIFKNLILKFNLIFTKCITPNLN